MQVALQVVSSELIKDERSTDLYKNCIPEEPSEKILCIHLLIRVEEQWEIVRPHFDDAIT